MGDTWEDLQAVKSKRNSLREKLEKRKKERQDILGTTTLTTAGDTLIVDEKRTPSLLVKSEIDSDPEIEKCLLGILCDKCLVLPVNSKQLIEKLNGKLQPKIVVADSLYYFLEKLSSSSDINIKDVSIGSETGYEVICVEHKQIQRKYDDLIGAGEDSLESFKRLNEDDSDNSNDSKVMRLHGMSDKKNNSKDSNSDIMSLLSMQTTREKQSKQVGEEILELLSKPTAKERSLAEKFKSQGGTQVMKFCSHGTRAECLRSRSTGDVSIKKQNESDQEFSDRKELANHKCSKLHFKKIIQGHTDESLGDCSFLNTCFHMDTCKYVHYEVDALPDQINTPKSDIQSRKRSNLPQTKRTVDSTTTLYPAQWIQCDLRYLDMTALGKFAVVMADPPWDIHMELPYGTMSDDEMRQLGVPALQDDGLIFLWVTGRAMELGRECLRLWGYERVDELIWVKTNQLQRIIRTGRTGHWLNHGKEHCLVGMKGKPTNLNRGLDCDVIVAEVRATSHKPDEIYGIIERLSPGTRKIELFGRPHNVQPNWITLGNQLDGIHLVDPELISQFQKRYPDGNCMAPSQSMAISTTT